MLKHVGPRMCTFARLPMLRFAGERTDQGADAPMYGPVYEEVMGTLDNRLREVAYLTL